MDVALVYKWGYDPDDAYASADGSFKWKNGKLVASDDDVAAVANARAVAQKTDGKIYGVTIGNGDVSWAAARGVPELHSVGAYMPSSDDLVTAREIHEAIAAAGKVDLVVIADAIEQAGVAPALAALLGVPFVGSIRDFSVSEDDPDTIIAHRATDEGIAALSFMAPAVISVEAVDSEKTVPSMKEMLAARKTPVNKIDAAAEITGGLVMESRAKAQLKQAKMFEGTPAEAAQKLVEQLRADGAL